MTEHESGNPGVIPDVFQAFAQLSITRYGLTRDQVRQIVERAREGEDPQDIARDIARIHDAAAAQTGNVDYDARLYGPAYLLAHAAGDPSPGAIEAFLSAF